MNVAIVGGRDFDDYEQFKSCINGEKIKFKCIISGGARGVDSMAERYAKEICVPVNIYWPDWTNTEKPLVQFATAKLLRVPIA